MARVHVEVGHYLAHRLGSQDLEGPWEREIELFSGWTLRDVLSRLAEKEPGFSEEICDGERLHRGVLLLINGKLHHWAKAAEVELRDGDRVSFFPTIGGG